MKYNFFGFLDFVLPFAEGKVLGFCSPPADWGIVDSRIVQMFGFLHFALAVA